MARTAELLLAGMRLTDHIGLGVLTAQFPLASVERVLVETARQSMRERALPAHVIIRRMDLATRQTIGPWMAVCGPWCI